MEGTTQIHIEKLPEGFYLATSQWYPRINSSRSNQNRNAWNCSGCG